MYLLLHLKIIEHLMLRSLLLLLKPDLSHNILIILLAERRILVNWYLIDHQTLQILFVLNHVLQLLLVQELLGEGRLGREQRVGRQKGGSRVGGQQFARLEWGLELVQLLLL
jgi:hypothetical protein